MTHATVIYTHPGQHVICVCWGCVARVGASGVASTVSWALDIVSDRTSCIPSIRPVTVKDCILSELITTVIILQRLTRPQNFRRRPLRNFAERMRCMRGPTMTKPSRQYNAVLAAAGDDASSCNESSPYYGRTCSVRPGELYSLALHGAIGTSPAPILQCCSAGTLHHGSLWGCPSFGLHSTTIAPCYEPLQ